MCHKMSTNESDLALLCAIDGEGAEASLSIADYVSMNDWPSVHGVPPFPTCHREEDSDATGRQSASAPGTSAQVCECASNDLKDPEARSQSDTASLGQSQVAVLFSGKTDARVVTPAPVTSQQTRAVPKKRKRPVAKRVIASHAKLPIGAMLIPPVKAKRLATAEQEKYDYTKAHNALGVAQDYSCKYCGTVKTSASLCNDGRVRIRCTCGGQRQDGVPRMHAKWQPLQEGIEQLQYTKALPVTAEQLTAQWAAGRNCAITQAGIQQLLSSVLDPEEVMSVTFHAVDDTREVKVLEVILTQS